MKSFNDFCNQVGLVSVLTLLAVGTSGAQGVSFSTTISRDYFIITTNGTGDDASDGTASVQISNFEIGANKAPVPSTDDFLSGGSSGGPTLLGAVPDIPASGVVPVGQGIGGNANVAIINEKDEFDASDAGVYATPGIGIQIAAPNDSFNKSDNSFFNDPNHFPNTFTPGGSTGVLGNLGGTGSDVNPGSAVESTRIDADGTPGNAGITFGFDHGSLNDELSAARIAISSLLSTGTLDVSGGNGGQFDTSTSLSGPATISSSPTPSTSTFSPSSDSRDFVISAVLGLNIIDISTGGNDISLDNSNLIIDGPAGATVIFRFDNNNFLVSNSNILLGDGGIGLNNVLFFTDQESASTIFSFQNTILNGAAFYSLGDGGGSIEVSNGQGSTQFIADTVKLSDVRFTRWAFKGNAIPEPTSVTLVTIIGSSICCRRRRGITG